MKTIAVIGTLRYYNHQIPNQKNRYIHITKEDDVRGMTFDEIITEPNYYYPGFDELIEEVKMCMKVS